MASYYGGSTIIRWGKFASNDPADSKGHHARNKQSNGGKNSKASRSKAPKVKKPKSPEKILESGRKSLLHLIIDQILRGQDEFKIPSSVHPELQAAILRAGSPINWATSQREFEALEAKKRRQREENARQIEQRQQRKSVKVEVKRKKRGVAAVRPVPLSKPELTKEDIHKNNRNALLRHFVDQMIKKKGVLTLPKLERRLHEEVKEAGSPLLWNQAQPDFKLVFKARYIMHQKSTLSAPKKSKKSSRTNKKVGK
ncbi:MAG: hypothetical protein P8N72_04260 [Flavimaricola sp.]|nr:hypothetical protein [Flavimaricola sp.]